MDRKGDESNSYNLNTWNHPRKSGPVGAKLSIRFRLYGIPTVYVCIAMR